MVRIALVDNPQFVFGNSFCQAFALSFFLLSFLEIG